MRVDRTMASVSFKGEDDAVLTVGYDNRGEPYRQGVRLELENPDYRTQAYVFLEDWEAKALRDLLLTLYPIAAAPTTGETT